MLRCTRMINPGPLSALLFMLALLLGGTDLGFGQGSSMSPRTDYFLRKSNQSKVFYYGNTWWAIAFDSLRSAWFMWQYDGSTWTKKTGVQNGADYNIDTALDSAASKLYVFSSHASAPYFRRFSYNGTTWVKDAGFPRLFTGFGNQDGNNPINLVKARNGYLWVFRVANNKLQAKYSTNDGKNWSKITTIKILSVNKGTAAAVAFSDGVSNYVGVAYGEAPVAGSKFGFLRHNDADADIVWSDETSAIGYLGSESGRNEVSLAVDPSNQIYMFTRTNGGTSGDPRNTLYMRSTSGVWTPFLVNAVNGANWTSPAIAIDTENGKIHVMGTNVNNGRGEYKTGLLGLGSDLQNATTQSLFSSGADIFQHLSVSARTLNSATGMMVTAGDTTQHDTWFNLMSIPATVPITINSVLLSKDTVNVASAYSVGMTTSAYGNLGANFSTITVKFPVQTVVPSVITPSDITVNGTLVTVASVNPGKREITLNTPVDVGGGASFTVVFAVTMGILNPSLPGAYALKGWTSSQNLWATSPNYNLAGAATSVISVLAKVFPADVDSAAQYTVGFRVGTNGRLLAGIGTLSVTFANDTKVFNGALVGATVNGVAATGTGNSAARRVDITVPGAVTINNNDSVTVFIPAMALFNPSFVNTFQLQVNTSVETTPIASNGFYIHKGRRVAGTTKNFDRGNQNKMFFHGGHWWLAAPSKTNNHWYLWMRSDTTWTQTIEIHDQGKSRPDCVLDSVNNKAYILLPGSNTTFVTRLSYAAGSWSVDAGYPKTVVSLQINTMNMVRANNGNLWVFWMADSTLWARRSTNEGSTWSADIAVKSHLNTASGLSDAVAFNITSDNYIGVGYAENNSNGISKYGFLRHQDGANNTTWIDESASTPQFTNTHANDHISMITYNNEIFMIVKTAGGGGNTTTNVGLLHRKVNGDWSSYQIVANNGWTRPVLAIDATNSQLYVFGTRESGVQYVEGKKVALGNYAALSGATIDTFMQYMSNNFVDLSTAGHVVTSASGLLLAGGNKTTDDLWVQMIRLPAGVVLAKSAPQPEAVNSQVAVSATNEDLQVGAYPNPMNPSTHIQFTLKVGASVKLQIFNVNGQLVKTLIDNDLPAGTHRRMWRGTNQQGEVVASGSYFYRLQVGGVMKTGQLYMIK